jgi:hypothetical protein
MLCFRRERCTKEPLQGGYWKSFDSLGHAHAAGAPGVFSSDCGEATAVSSRERREKRSVFFIVNVRIGCGETKGKEKEIPTRWESDVKEKI